ncbi:hypothetical protein ACU60T_24135 [Klebsiella aerogenes]
MPRHKNKIAIDIAGLLELARRKGPGAGLEKRPAYLWQSCTEPVAEALFSQHNLKMAFKQREENGGQATLAPQEKYAPQ